MLEGIEPTDTTFEPITVQVRDASNPGNVRDVEIVGIIATKASAHLPGAVPLAAAFDAVFPKPESNLHFVKLAAGRRRRATRRKNIENDAAAPRACRRDSLRKLIDD